MMSCQIINKSNSKIPNRPNGVPYNTFWIGGADGGQWYQIDSIDKRLSVAWIKIYNDFSGELQINRQFNLHCDSSTNIDLDSLKYSIDGFDGKRIYLINTDKNNRKCFLQ